MERKNKNNEEYAGFVDKYNWFFDRNISREERDGRFVNMGEPEGDFTRRIVLSLAFLLLVISPMLTIFLPSRAELDNQIEYSAKLKQRVEKVSAEHKKLEDVKIGLEKNDPYILETFVRQNLGYARPDEIIIADEAETGWQVTPSEKYEPMPKLKEEARLAAPKHTRAVSFIVYVSLVVVAYLLLFRERKHTPGA